MIRACRLPSVLNRICDKSIPSALLVTFDGEVLGQSTSYPHHKDPAFFGTLVADIASDYQRAGQDYAAINQNNSKSHLRCLLIEMEGGYIGVSACATVNCFVVAVGKPDTPPGLLKARLECLASYVEDSLSVLADNS